MGSDCYQIASWTESPFTSHDKRGYIIEHQVVVEHYGGLGADVRHEIRSTDYDGCPDEWTDIDAVEIRDHGSMRVKNEPEWFA
jgi:hypothetical protein